ncbi:uncharacterized protein LOC111102200 [Crassostrea virginica]
MQVTTIENVILAFVLFTLTGAQQWQRRRFCELKPFARRCMGIAAKRDVSSNMKPEFGRQQRLLEIENMLENERMIERTESPERLFPTTLKDDFPLNILKQILNNRRQFAFKQQDEVSISLDNVSETVNGYPNGF